MIDAEGIRRCQDEATDRWHGEGSPEGAREEFGRLVEANHRANFDLWHEEDKARDPEASDAEIARVKRAIDGLNQRRNDLVEAMDEMLVQGAAPGMRGDAPMHSETPGMMIDRMSILALKIFHMREQVERTEAQRGRNSERLRVLERQRADLAGCLAELWREVLGGARRFGVYRQMKMYNDPELNPLIYGSRMHRRRD